MVDMTFYTKKNKIKDRITTKTFNQIKNII